MNTKPTLFPIRRIRRPLIDIHAKQLTPLAQTGETTLPPENKTGLDQPPSTVPQRPANLTLPEEGKVVETAAIQQAPEKLAPASPFDDRDALFEDERPVINPPIVEAPAIPECKPPEVSANPPALETKAEKKAKVKNATAKKNGDDKNGNGESVLGSKAGKTKQKSTR